MKLTNPIVLKAALLLVLAANMSWERFEISSMQLATTGVREAVSAGPGASAAAPATASTNSTTPSPGAVTTATAAPPAAVQAAPSAAAPAVATKPSAPTDAERARLAALAEQQRIKTSAIQSNDTQSVCGHSYQVTYIQSDTNDGRTVTRIHARDASAAEGAGWVSTFEMSGTLASNMNPEQKTRINSLLQAHVREERIAKKLTCPGTPATDKDEKTSKADDREADRKECLVGKNGRSLDSGERLRCFADRLESMKREEPAKDEKRSEFSVRMMEETKAIVGKLRTMARKALLDKNDKDYDAAVDALDRASDSVESLVARHNVRDSKDLNNLANSLSALKQAGEAEHKAREYKEAAGEARTRNRSAWENLKRAEEDLKRFPGQDSLMHYHMARNAFINSANDTAQLDWQIKNEFEIPFMMPMRSNQNLRYLSAVDFKDFSTSFRDLQTMMEQALNPQNALSNRIDTNGRLRGTVLGDHNIPQNLGSFRSGANSSFSSGDLPSRSSIPGSALRTDYSRPSSLYDRSSLSGGSLNSTPSFQQRQFPRM